MTDYTTSIPTANGFTQTLIQQVTLRDQFAMAALTGMLAANYSGDRVAKSAYQIADYMLEARKEKK